MDARTFLGLQPSHNPYRWQLPVSPGISTGSGFLFGGSGLGAAIEAMEGTTGRPVVWATAQYLSYARPGTVIAASSRSVISFPPRAARTPVSTRMLIGVSSRGMASGIECT